MKKLLAVLMLMVMLLAGCGAQEGDAVIGSVNGENVYQSEYDYYLGMFYNQYFESYYDMFLLYYGVDMLNEESSADLMSDLEESSWQIVLQAAVTRQLAAEYGITFDDYYAKDLLDEGNWLVLKTGALYNKLYEALSDELFEATVAEYEDEAKAAYDADPAMWDSRKVSHIIVADYDTAAEIIDKLNNGGDFAALAAEYGTDGTATQGGVLDCYFNYDGYCIDTDSYLVKDFATGAFTLAEVGDYTTTPVKSEFGYHVIKLDDIQGYEFAKPYIAAGLVELTEEDYTEYMNSKIDECIANAEITCKVDFKYYEAE
ncbi:MAG: peptidylprolyl isomerase [Firmicutes bacterium]|nr:peptidylprolyl isomerase [Bacillota bacterium]